MREPQSIGTLVCGVLLTDMVRHSLFFASLSWTDECSNSQKYEVCERWLGEPPPYHNLLDSISHPPALITTGLSDDRIHPAHALELYVRLRETSP